MKTALFITLSVLIFGLISCSEKYSDVPQDVVKNFNSKFPDAEEIEWEKEDDNEWEAEFEQSGTEYTASFDSKGAWLETERYVKETDLPLLVLESLKANYVNYKIEEIAYVEKDTNNYYEIELLFGEKSMEVAISENGNTLNPNETEDDDDNEDDD